MLQVKKNIHLQLSSNDVDSFCLYIFVNNCRDETTTVNRQPEFTQLDVELSFTQPESIMKLIENVLVNSWPGELPKIPSTFKRMTYEEAMETYGSDKPDIRSNEFLVSFTHAFSFQIENKTNFSNFSSKMSQI